MFGKYSFLKVSDFIHTVASTGSVSRQCVEYIKGGAGVEDIEEHVILDPASILDEGRREVESLLSSRVDLSSILPQVPEGMYIGQQELAPVIREIVYEKEEILLFS